jgi:hypothetical protein
MVGRVIEIARAIHWACVAACTLAAVKDFDAISGTEIKPRLC